MIWAAAAIWLSVMSTGLSSGVVFDEELIFGMSGILYCLLPVDMTLSAALGFREEGELVSELGLYIEVSVLCVDAGVLFADIGVRVVGV